MKMIQFKKKKKRSIEWSQVYGDIFRRSRAATSTVLGLVWLNFELILDVVASSRYIYEPQSVKTSLNDEVVKKGLLTYI